MDCVELNKRPLVTGEDGFKVLEIIEAARSSDATGGQLYDVNRIPIERAL